MPKISGCMITYNEEKVIRRTLENLSRFCDEIIVFDSFSTDSTPEILKQYNCTVYQHEFNNHRDQKNRAIEKCSNEWIILLDADEYCNNRLVNMLDNGTLLEGLEAQGIDALGIPRYNLEDGVGPRGWPDIQTRLFKNYVRHGGHPFHHSSNINAKKHVLLSRYQPSDNDAMFIYHDKDKPRQMEGNKLYYAMRPQDYKILPEGVDQEFAAAHKGSKDEINPNVYQEYIKGVK